MIVRRAGGARFCPEGCTCNRHAPKRRIEPEQIWEGSRWYWHSSPLSMDEGPARFLPAPLDIPEYEFVSGSDYRSAIHDIHARVARGEVLVADPRKVCPP